MAKKKGKNKMFWIAIALIALGILLVAASFLIRHEKFLEKREIFMSLKVDSSSGIDLNKTALTFGNIMPGDSVSRYFTLGDTYNFPIKAEINIEGNIMKFISCGREVKIGINESKEIGVSAIIPANESFGNYSGTLVVSIEKDI